MYIFVYILYIYSKLKSFLLGLTYSYMSVSPNETTSFLAVQIKKKYRLLLLPFSHPEPQNNDST